MKEAFDGLLFVLGVPWTRGRAPTKSWASTGSTRRAPAFNLGGSERPIETNTACPQMRLASMRPRLGAFPRAAASKRHPCASDAGLMPASTTSELAARVILSEALQGRGCCNQTCDSPGEQTGQSPPLQGARLHSLSRRRVDRLKVVCSEPAARFGILTRPGASG